MLRETFEGYFGPEHKTVAISKPMKLSDVLEMSLKAQYEYQMQLLLLEQQTRERFMSENGISWWRKWIDPRRHAKSGVLNGQCAETDYTIEDAAHAFL